MLAKPIHMLNFVIFNKTRRANEIREVCFVQNEILVGRKDLDKPDFRPDLNLEDLHVSRRHTLIRKVGSKYFIQDLNSKRNTIVDGKSIGGHGEVELTPCACVQTGDTIWTIVPVDWSFIQCGDVIICASHLTEISYCLYHCGTQIIGPIVAVNLCNRQSNPMRLRLQIAGYSESCEVEIPAIEPISRISIGVPTIRLNLEKLKNQVEPIHTYVDVKIVGQTTAISRKDITVLGFWDWPYNEAARKAIAAFVSPRNSVIESIVLKAEEQLKDTTGFKTFHDLLLTDRDDTE
ncbi:MAG: FHA domain-containing protein, partial [Phycisphaerae bacterium]